MHDITLHGFNTNKKIKNTTPYIALRYLISEEENTIHLKIKNKSIINWGDGNIVNIGSNVLAYKVYDFSKLNSSIKLDNKIEYKEVVVYIQSQKGYSLTDIDLDPYYDNSDTLIYSKINIKSINAFLPNLNSIIINKDNDKKKYRFLNSMSITR